VALLRGIGPGNPKMRNAVLVEVLERAGVSAVRSVISSGNYLFTSDETRTASLEATLEAALHAHLGSPCSTIVRSRRQIETVAGLDVFDEHDDGPTARCNVTFLKRRPRADLAPLHDGDGYQVLGVHHQAVFFVVDSTRSKTPDVMARLEKHYGKAITTRTWKTVHRIAGAFDR
jgi:uncharacterized protein (DUF1697 family)